MERSDLVQRYPRLFHMAEDGAWDNIRGNGLLSTTALVDRYAPDDVTRSSILRTRRADMIRLERAGLPPAVIRDQKPLKYLPEKLTPGTTEQQFLDALNGRVFFWLDEERLHRLLSARWYRSTPRIVLTLRTEELLEAHGDKVTLSYLNSGAVNQKNHPQRGVELFEPIESYAARRPRGASGRVSASPPVELTVTYSVPNVAEYVHLVERRQGTELLETIFSR